MSIRGVEENISKVLFSSRLAEGNWRDFTNAVLTTRNLTGRVMLLKDYRLNLNVSISDLIKYRNHKLW